jgi:hypothetical protein
VEQEDEEGTMGAMGGPTPIGALEASDTHSPSHRHAVSITHTHTNTWSSE